MVQMSQDEVEEFFVPARHAVFATNSADGPPS